MGYKNNQQQFLQLAKYAPLEKLLALSSNQEREAFLWGNSCLLPETLPSYEIHTELKSFVNSIWQNFWALREGKQKPIFWSYQSQTPPSTLVNVA